jgi:hypothetical protein
MTAITTLTARQELEIHVAIGSELFDYVFDGKLASSEITETLREVVREIGNGHTDEYLTEVTIQRIEEARGWF